MRYQNPILRGMYPDPSVCRSGDKYYMVCSSFQYFPAVPLFESTDMVNWQQIGHCLTRKSQIDLTGTSTCGGVFAPTIREHNGRFYMVTTNDTIHRNFYVYTDDIHGEWSEPILVEQDGIDPSLFFEGDKVYFISNGYDHERGCGCIQMCEIDIATGKKKSETKPLWYGTGGRFVEAPHLYKFGGYYYLLDAEGGTEYGHMVNYVRSKSMWGPFTPFPQNPALTNRNLGGYLLQGAGHGDLLEDKYGNWWFVHLAFRQIDSWLTYHHLGRETCLVPVTWKDGWFYLGDGTSRLEYDLPDRPEVEQKLDFSRTFETLEEKKDWCFLRNYRPECYQFRKDGLRLTGMPDTLFEKGLPTMAAVRQTAFQEDISCTVTSSCREAGITIYMDELHHYDLYCTDEGTAVLRLTIGCISKEMKTVPVDGAAALHIRATAYGYSFAVRSGDTQTEMGFADTRYLSSEVAGGFTGVMIGLYAVDKAGRTADFTDLHLTHTEQR